MTLPSLFNGTEEPQDALKKILKGGLLIELDKDVTVMFDFDRDDRRPLVTVKYKKQFLSPQEYLNETQGHNT